MKLPIVYRYNQHSTRIDEKSIHIRPFNRMKISFIQYFSKLPKCFGIVAKNLAACQPEFNSTRDMIVRLLHNRSSILLPAFETAERRSTREPTSR